VRRTGGSREFPDRIVEYVEPDYPSFRVGERYILFLKRQEWHPPAPFTGVYYTEATQGPGSVFEIRDNTIHDMRGQNAMGITVYATEPTAISDLVIDGNEIYDCEPATSEALTLNGNVDGFVVSDNYVHDVDNIGIDCIGGETDLQPDDTKVCRNGVIRGNRVERARSSYG
jgi:hypothetical protein